MPYEALSRALAYASCFTCLTLFASSMVLTAINVGKLGPPDACMFAACAIHSADAVNAQVRSEHLEVIAAALPPQP